MKNTSCYFVTEGIMLISPVARINNWELIFRNEREFSEISSWISEQNIP
jgi:hypothetical protein